MAKVPKAAGRRPPTRKAGAGKAATRKPSARKSVARKPVARKSRARAPRHHHHVYVIELARSVWLEPAFRRANPDGDITKPALYVGMTGLTPDARFDKHKAGIKDGRYVKEYGLRLLPALYEAYNPMPYEAACEMEVELAIGLREEGYGVWQA